MTPRREFFAQDAVSLAPQLLGMHIVSRAGGAETAGIIVETEAYAGKADPAAHSCRGNPSGRTAVLYGPGGHAYIYLIYGMYCCLNISCAPEGDPQCVLIRALEPLSGLEAMATRRARARRSASQGQPLSPAGIRSLCNGPGKAAMALGLDRALNGEDLLGQTLFLRHGTGAPPFEIIASPRVNIDYAGQAAQWPYRFSVAGSPFVSRPRPVGPQ